MGTVTMRMGLQTHFACQPNRIHNGVDGCEQALTNEKYENVWIVIDYSQYRYILPRDAFEYGKTV